MPRPTYLQLLLRELDPEIARSIAAAGPGEASALLEPLAPLPMPAAHYAACALLELGPEAAPALERWILAHGNSRVLWAMLENAADPGPGLEAFGALLEADDPGLLAAAAAAVGKCGAAGLRYAERLRVLAETGSDSWLRSHALRALGQVGAKHIPLLVKAVREGDEDECLAAVAALGLLGPDAIEAVDAICDCLGHEAPFVAMAAPNALVRIDERSPRVGDALAAALARTGDQDECEGLLHAIGRLGAPSPAARAALLDALANNDAERRAAGAVAAYLAGGDPAGVRAVLPDAARILAEWNVDPAPFADGLLRLLEARAREGPPAGVDDLGGLLQQAMAKVQPERLTIGDQSIGVLDPSAEIVVDTTYALIPLARRLGDPAAIPALEQIAADERSQRWTREIAADAASALRGQPE